MEIKREEEESPEDRKYFSIFGYLDSHLLKVRIILDRPWKRKGWKCSSFSLLSTSSRAWLSSFSVVAWSKLHNSWLGYSGLVSTSTLLTLSSYFSLWPRRLVLFSPSSASLPSRASHAFYVIATRTKLAPLQCIFRGRAARM